MTLNYGSPAFPTLLPRGHPICSRLTAVAVNLSGSSLEACPQSVVAVPSSSRGCGRLLTRAPPGSGGEGHWWLAWGWASGAWSWPTSREPQPPKKPRLPGRLQGSFVSCLFLAAFISELEKFS